MKALGSILFLFFLFLFATPKVHGVSLTGLFQLEDDMDKHIENIIRINTSGKPRDRKQEVDWITFKSQQYELLRPKLILFIETFEQVVALATSGWEESGQQMLKDAFASFNRVMKPQDAELLRYFTGVYEIRIKGELGNIYRDPGIYERLQGVVQARIQRQKIKNEGDKIRGLTDKDRAGVLTLLRSRTDTDAAFTEINRQIEEVKKQDQALPLTRAFQSTVRKKAKLDSVLSTMEELEALSSLRHVAPLLKEIRASQTKWDLFLAEVMENKLYLNLPFGAWFSVVAPYLMEKSTPTLTKNFPSLSEVSRNSIAYLKLLFAPETFLHAVVPNPSFSIVEAMYERLSVLEAKDPARYKDYYLTLQRSQRIKKWVRDVENGLSGDARARANAMYPRKKDCGPGDARAGVEGFK